MSFRIKVQLDFVSSASSQSAARLACSGMPSTVQVDPSTLQFETVVRDANVNAGLRGAVRHTYRDVRELITSVKEFNNAGTEVIWTSYAYDALKQITQVVDDKNNTTSIVHDNLGRRTAIDNPDTGRTETQYDLASNEIRKVTANLRAQAKAIDYNYDFNRLVGITYPNFPANNVTYTYGAPGAAFNAAGRVTRTTSQMGVEERQYGKLGETVYEKKTVTTFTNPLSPSVYETRFHFETFGRLLRSKRSINRVLAGAEGLCWKGKGYWLVNAMRQGSSAS